MKRWLWLAAAAVIVIAAGVTLVALPRGQEWTSSSPEAVAEFQAGIDAQMKLYEDDARRHFRRALELDPDFVMANLFTIDGYRHDGDEAKVEALREKMLSADLSALTPRERFFVERARARNEKRTEDAERLLDEYVARYPNDPYILHQKALRAWGRGDLDEAERLNYRLVEISPNWVIAYNQLGYINMMKGRFTEAEEYFKSYRFIAPDQANPHDSLGELFITLGRYAEARETLEKAVEIKPDFWAAYSHLVLLGAFGDDPELVDSAIERATALGAPEPLLSSMACLEDYAALRKAEAWETILKQAESSCVTGLGDGFAIATTHLAACKIGDWKTAEAIEAKAAEFVKKSSDGDDMRKAEPFMVALLHMEGIRLALQGDRGAAVEKLREADQHLTYMEAGSAIYKLINRAILAEVLLADGQDSEAAALMTEVRAVNPVLAADFEAGGHETLGLEKS
jgi:tetratricopeptide (TPR) repeat protein